MGAVAAGRVLVLTRSEVASLIDLAECAKAVEEAFRLHGEGRTASPGILGFPAPGGGFHIKAAALPLDRSYFAAKVNGNYSANPERGLPAIQGVVVLCDAEDGTPLALLDSIEITILRTGAATAVAAKRLARAGASVATVCGCGNQGRVQLRALAVARRLTRAFAFDAEPGRAGRFAEEMTRQLGFPVEAVSDLPSALRRSDLVVTATPSRTFFVRREDVRPGTFLAAVGADSPDKQELDPGLVASSKLVVDVRTQCAEIGELHHAIAKGLMRAEGAHAELGEVVANRRPGRESQEEIIVFDSTGTALQDVAAAALVYEKAAARGVGTAVDLSG
jgi:alanine dehydrogenase